LGRFNAGTTSKRKVTAWDPSAKDGEAPAFSKPESQGKGEIMRTVYAGKSG